jgi:DNA-binding XRE family transcriptional regulator
MSEDTVLAELGGALAARRIEMELTQAELAEQAGIGKRTVERVEAGSSCQTSVLIRIMRVLELLEGLGRLIPPTGPRPMDLLKRKGKARKRASSKRRRAGSSPASKQDSPTGGKRAGTEWTWGDEE